MASTAGAALTKGELKEKVRPLILAQGNIFIKELLKDHGLHAGDGTKSSFGAALDQAIDDGKLTQDMFEEWLVKVEGWGDQHIYLCTPPKLGHAEILAAIMASSEAHLLGQSANYAFPTALTLSDIALVPDRLTLAWHQGNGGWARTPKKDKRRKEGGDLYEYRAYRQKFERKVVRFEWAIGSAYCGLFNPLPNEGTIHDDTQKLVEGELVRLGLMPGPLEKIDLTKAFRKLLGNDRAGVQRGRLGVDGGHLDLVANEGLNLADVAALRNARRGINFQDFRTADGKFNFLQKTFPNLERDAIKIEGFGVDRRIRIWVQCKRADVYEVLREVWRQNR
jgi:hypothetical protein